MHAVRRAATRPLNGLIWPKDGWHLDRLSRNGGGGTFFPWPSAIPRGSQESPAAAILRCAPASKLVRRRSPPACRSPSRPRWSRARNSRGEVTWPNIGSFKKSGSEFQGEIVTLSVQTKNVRIVPEANRANDNAPSHRVFVGRGGDRGRLVEALQRGPRLPFGQAGRSFVQRADLRQPLRRRGRRRFHPHLVSRPPAERRLSRTYPTAPPGPPGGAFRFHDFTDCRLSANRHPTTGSATQCQLSRLAVPVQ